VTRDLDQVRDATYRQLGGTADAPVFRMVGWEADGSDVALTYAIDGLGSFTERLTFVDLDVGAAADRSPAVRGAIQLTLLTAGLSYLKVCLPREVRLGPAPDAAVRMVEALLTDGLAELAFDHDLDLRGAFDVHHDPVDDVPVEGPAPDGVLVPVGGGKDSAVTATVAARHDPTARTIAVNPRRSMHATADAVGLPLVEVRRKLDPRLFELNDAGAINGHVPITAIVSSICAVAAATLGRGTVLLSNERSADEPTRRLADRDVNHQYSKSSGFESLHVAAAAALTGGSVAAWSFLRPASELLIARAFARTPDLLGAVNSCNRAYALNTERIEWCGDCPKCRFVQLTLAPFLDRDDLVGRLGFDALDDPAQLPGVRALVDPDAKPFECVGTIDEAQLALDLLADDPAWADALAVRELGHAGTGAAARLADLVSSTDPSALPEPQRTWFVEDVLGDAPGSAS
jgi:UDP-N-acetyl-alpha-D-muramoyl-L-alanyl-L-glutamate epimerase